MSNEEFNGKINNGQSEEACSEGYMKERENIQKNIQYLKEDIDLLAKELIKRYPGYKGTIESYQTNAKKEAERLPTDPKLAQESVYLFPFLYAINFLRKTNDQEKDLQQALEAIKKHLPFINDTENSNN